MSDALRQRLDALLRVPDPPEMPPRRHRWTQAGDEHRRTTVLLPLLIRWAQNRIVLLEEGDY